MTMPLTISEEDFDALPFGVIRINAAGEILQYNAFEAKLSGLSPVSVIGKNFFQDVAPCTDVQDFRGRFESAITEPLLNLQFAFTFPFSSGERRVFIHILAAPESSFWIFVSDSQSGRNISKLLGARTYER
ncbi:MAG: hypothetical protein NVS9B15_18800 [Acidobacteriaceae bacterium]